MNVENARMTYIIKRRKYIRAISLLLTLPSSLPLSFKAPNFYKPLRWKSFNKKNTIRDKNHYYWYSIRISEMV
jgi:hypothetical protein